MEIKILGKVIGTASGWDQFNETSVFYYDVCLNALGISFVKNHCVNLEWMEIDLTEAKVNVSSGNYPDAPIPLDANWLVLVM